MNIDEVKTYKRCTTFWTYIICRMSFETVEWIILAEVLYYTINICLYDFSYSLLSKRVRGFIKRSLKGQEVQTAHTFIHSGAGTNLKVGAPVRSETGGTDPAQSAENM